MQPPLRLGQQLYNDDIFSPTITNFGNVAVLPLDLLHPTTHMSAPNINVCLLAIFLCAQPFMDIRRTQLELLHSSNLYDLPKHGLAYMTTT